MAMELMLPATTFTNDSSIVIIDPEREIDMRKFVANEAVKRITTHFKERKKQADKKYEEATRENERATRENERATRENERATRENEVMQKRVAEAKANLAKIGARGKEVYKQVNTTIDDIEEYMIQLDITLLPKIPQMQDFVKQYMLLCKEIERKPNAVGQKFIDAYQKLQK
ncbi:hypothetical protein ACILD7_04565 [Capnocytophaga canimorsus]|uniref:hypothetical protein n=1 Tax=Capnocytophaga canimorsus TaxID=28188 RepID=UPI0037CF1AF7